MRKALLTVAEDPGLDALVLATDLPKIAPPDPAPMIELFRGTAEILRNSPKPIVVMGNTLTDITAFGRQVAAETGYPGVLGGIHHGLTALGRAVAWSEAYRSAGQGVSPVTGPPAPVELAEEPEAAWSEHRASRFLAGHGIPVVPGVLAASPEAAAAAAAELGYPVVVKLAADDVDAQERHRRRQGRPAHRRGRARRVRRRSGRGAGGGRGRPGRACPADAGRRHRAARRRHHRPGVGPGARGRVRRRLGRDTQGHRRCSCSPPGETRSCPR